MEMVLAQARYGIPQVKGWPTFDLGWPVKESMDKGKKVKKKIVNQEKERGWCIIKEKMTREDNAS